MGNCVARSEKEELSTFHRLYAHLLLKRARGIWHKQQLFPTLGLIYLEQLECLLPEIEQEHRSKPFDLIWMEFSYLYPLVKVLRNSLPEAPVVCNAHNNEWELQERTAGKYKTPLARAWGTLESDMLRYWESQMLRECKLTFCCSKIDRQGLVNLEPECEEKIFVAPNGVDTDCFHTFKVAPNSESPLILFTGSASYGPNQQAGKLLVEEIMPLVHHHSPHCRLRLAGRNAKAEWAHLQNGRDWLEVISDPPDMRPYFEDADIFAVPLQYGGGTRLKILEAMSMGKPVISTSIGAEGLEVTPETDLILAESSESMASAILNLIQNKSLRESLGINARKLVEQKYQWSQITKAALTQLENALD
ncbi:glycosyltransferase family 4 protein [Cerasicoccus frondis]|uniref:glycosyltransferase family 4 protein n=1 Tax=Cerasicoccus frondis TaxID=490090 RepID=UPI002852592B|nr:glycosyltransferase family 4 protein [Cerasicoccus frondis]